jgi:uncharacterized membrane protein
MSAGATDGGTATLNSERARRIADGVDRAVLWFVERWVYGLLALMSVVTALPLLAPWLKANGYEWPARGIYLGYRLVCHQRPERSFHPFGAQMAFCERDTAICVTATLLLAFYSLTRRHWSTPTPSLLWPILLALPMAIDGGTQLVGLRESTWELRVVTGAIFSIGAAWFVLPRLEVGFRDVRTTMNARLRGVGATSR